ncbi:MAG TPA: carbonic anhydrase [Candidatus Limnocylindrales bacterium]|jgi:carbonic anhydrase|nr:carbonic anhydrase [Candidatus Limnocylindrales bacterium]
MRPEGEFERILEQNERFVEAFDRSALTAAPLTGLAILTCMDARIDVEDALGLRVGDAHIVRNAGGLATEDAIRSLVVSQQLLGTREVLVIAHSKCGLHGADEGDIRSRVETSTGTTTEMAFGAFPDLDGMVREQVETLRHEPRLLDVPVRGLVYEVETGRLRQVA